MSIASAPEATERRETLSEQDFDRVRAMIRDLAGIVIEPQKRQMVHARLSRRLRALGLDSFEAYLDRIERSRDPMDVQDFINAITTNLTSFFRESHHFEHFRQEVLATLPPGSERLRIWSAGCSSGEEPYSIALTALTAGTSLPGDTRILATDLDTTVLARARAATYPAEKAGPALASYKAHVERADDEMLRIGMAARNLVAFRQLNLMSPWPMQGLFDAVFCRNVLIYFSAETKATLVNRFAEKLKPGGILYLGHSESILGEHPLFTNEGQTTYRRREG